jgi:glycosyltransferase involved in cell wall biosynthesis
MSDGGAHLLVTTDAVGGVWQYSLDLARELARHGWRTTLAVLGPAPGHSQREGAASIPGLNLLDTALPLDWMAKDDAAIARAGGTIAALARSLGADIVHLNSPALAAATAFNVPVVAVTHSCTATWWAAMQGGPLPTDLAWRPAITAAGLAAADRIVAPSAAFAAATQDAYRLRQRPIVVHNGRTPLARPSAAMHDFCFAVGRLWDKAKNVATLDRAAGRLSVPFRAAGPLHGPNGEAAARFDHLHALGSVSEAEIGRWLASRPVFLSAAQYEPFGLAVLEAAAAGCPLVLSDIPTFRELWDGAATFVAANDAEGFADAAGEIVGDAGLRLALGQAAQARAARYTPAAMAAGMAAIYRGLGVAPRAGASAPKSAGKAAA